jgi:hypothetical protein
MDISKVICKQEKMIKPPMMVDLKKNAEEYKEKKKITTNLSKWSNRKPTVFIVIMGEN